MQQGIGYENLKSAIEQEMIEHKPITFPINHIKGGIFESANGIKFDFDYLGIDYMAYRTKGDKRYYGTLHSEDRWEELEAQINQDWEDSGSKRVELIAALYNGSLVGLLTKYNPVTHASIVDAIESAYLERDVYNFYINQMVMRIYMAINVGERFLVSLKITNGHSGHVSFGYAASFKTGTYEFDIPLVDRSRHLGRIDKVLANLKEIIEAAGELKIIETLKTISVSRIQQIIDDRCDDRTKRMETIINTIDRTACGNALEYIVSIGNYTNASGYKTAATTIIDAIMNELFPSK